MPRLILLLAVVFALVLLIRRVQLMPPHKRRSGYLQLIFGAAAVGVVLLTLAGKMHWIGAAITGLLVVMRQSLPVLIRSFPMLQQLWQRHQSPSNAGGQTSEVRSTVLKMTLDHSSGELSGDVLTGPFEGWQLQEMTREQLLELLAYCRAQDEDASQLLLSYLEQRFPDGFESDASASDANLSNQGMNRREALAVLGLTEDATDEDIIKAHRHLMQKMHPDRGGNDYLASKINEAKDFLLGAQGRRGH